MIILVAALVAAAASVFVAVFDRRFVARDERRRWELADKRQVYAQFLGACTQFSTGRMLVEIEDHSVLTTRTEMLILRLAELNLVASAEVRTAAQDLFKELARSHALDHKPGEDPGEGERRKRVQEHFIEVARRDLGY